MAPLRGDRDASTTVVDDATPVAVARRSKRRSLDLVSELSQPLAPGSRLPFVVGLLGIGLAYFAFAKIGLALATINPSATPIWPPTGLALAAVILWGYRISPAIFLAAWLANATTAGSLYTSSAIALGNTLESIVGGYLVHRWSDGPKTFDKPAGVVRFALISLVAAAPISASIGVGSLALTGYVESADLTSTWMTWWLGDLAGALVITPVLVLWTRSEARSLERKELLETGAVLGSAIAVGVIAFSPMIGQAFNRGPLGFLAVVPLMWAALRRGPRDTATVALVLSCFAVWGTMAGEGPFARSTLNDSLLLLLTFMISISVPTLALSADVAARRRTERSLRQAHEELDAVIHQRTAALDATRQELHQAQKMEALGQLTGGIAHDFNNVLTAIMNSLESARTSSAQDARTRVRLDRALEAARNGASLVQQMLIFARRHPLQLQPLDINAIISSGLTMFRRSCPENIEIHTDFESGLAWARVDSTQLQAAILNLAVNARDAMPFGGTLTIRTSGAAQAPPVPAGLPPGDYIWIEIADTGVGMTAETMARAFEPFFTTKEIGKGTGLGLSMVYSATRQMGGDLAIESTQGQGTTVRLFLPASASTEAGRDGEPPSQPEPEAAPASARAEPATVLYVEDDALVSLATVDMLEGAGYSIHAASNANRALALLQEHPEIDLMLTDIGLPGMDGHALAAEARRLRPELKILFLTGYDRTRWVGEPVTTPNSSYLGKPYQESDLFEALQRLSAGAESSSGRFPRTS